MTKTSHTSGPWKWHWRFEDGLATGSVFSEPRDGCAYAVAMCPRYQTKEQWEADARLIAAAPKMLNALKATRIYVETLEKHLDPRIDPGAPTIREHAAMLRAALSEATGDT